MSRSSLARMLIAATPTLVFVLVASLVSLRPAFVSAALTSIALLVGERLRRRPLAPAIIGACVATACAAVSAFTGEPRGFFLLPVVVPFVVLIACLGSVLARRPLAGLLLNRVCRGPARWFDEPALLRIYRTTTLVCAAVSAVNAASQMYFYSRSNLAVLAILHVASQPIFALIVTTTVVLVRRAMVTQNRDEGGADRPEGAG